ncbi:AlpA family transcriptional regulator [Aquitalea sp. LB_tupeE]|uniref:helix-turn-helix transcriptional regulator n=1 Tax=Aquitalea sp. LB_tupeE TaxID=2748078 RepID=UPI0015BE1C06|nr:AlpA family phage regulatory protein [Aquitalea sp. LB_tupeE]NWK79808.1 AlpA family phage regulatory protein [Aquitalea sp. LB_tupeE]
MKARAHSQQHIKIADAQANILAPYGALPATGFVRLADLRQIIPFSDSTVWRRVKNSTFPAPIRLSERVTAWRVEDIRKFLADPVNYQADAA